jgi:diguanylate cyclase (GGDEF)-like protein
MPTGGDRNKEIYERLKAGGTTEEEIEEVYRKLREAGYGEEETRRRLQEIVRRNRTGPRVVDRRGASGEGPSKPTPPEGGQDSATARRAEDWFPRVSPSLRRRVNKWAYRRGLLVTGLRQRWLDFVSIFRPSTPDIVNPRLLEALARRKHYLSQDPYGYSLVTTLDALHAISRTLLGRRGTQREEERAVAEALRRRDPFAVAYLEPFAHGDDPLRRSLEYLEFAYDNGASVEVTALARVTREVWRLALTTEQVSRRKVGSLLKLAGEVIQSQGVYDRYGLTVDDTAAIFQISLDNLERFKLELYPVVLKAIGTFYEFEDTAPEKHRRILGFLDLTEQEILTVRRFYQQEEKRKERELADQQLMQLQTIEREKEARFSHRFGGLLSILDALFPDSGIADLERHAFILPYFDERVFVHSLPFDHALYNVEAISRFDPLQPVMVIHRIVDNLLTPISEGRLERLLDQEGLADALVEIKEGWAATYNELFQPYLRGINEYARLVSDLEDAARLSRSPRARRLEEEINTLRNRAVQNYGHVLVRSAGKDATRLWLLVERLTLLLGELGEQLHQDIPHRSDPLSKRIYDALAEEPVVEFMDHATPGLPTFKPVLRQLRRYIEAKYRSSIGSIPAAAQLFLFDLLRAVAELYRFLLNNEASFLRVVGGQIPLAGEEEAAVWKREQESRTGDLSERLRIRLDEHLISEYVDSLTGMKSKDYYLKKLPAIYRKASQVGTPLSILMIDIDHFKWVNDELGHQKGDEVLRDAATTILDGIRRGSDIPIRYGGEELMVVTTAPLQNVITLAERLRHNQQEHLRERDLYAPVAAIGDARGEPCGTFSIGVAMRLDDEELDSLVARADRALYRSKDRRDSVTIGYVNRAGSEEFESFAEYADRLTRSRKDSE